MIHHQTYLFVGPPSSGKGTQSELLAKEFDLPRVDVGAVLRDRARDHDHLGQQIAAAMNAGAALDDTLIRPIAEPVFVTATLKGKGLIIDGYCRSVNQVDHLQELVADHKIYPVTVIHISVNEAEATKRMEHRRYCSGCNAQQYLVTTASTATACLRCGGHLIKRSDDSLEIFKERIITFHRVTVPAIHKLSQHFTMITIDGEHSIEAVHQTLIKALRHESH